MITRRAAREPLAYITGHKEFWSLDFAVGPGVLVPRPETETLIEQALAFYPGRPHGLAIADLGTGSGCLLIAAMKEFTASLGLGVDSSRKAMKWARLNGLAHNLTARAVMRLDSWNALPDEAFDIVFSNPPYVATADFGWPGSRKCPAMSRAAALDGGADGLGCLPRAGTAAPQGAEDRRGQGFCGNRGRAGFRDGTFVPGA